MSTAIPATPATGGDNYAATEAAKQAYAGYEVNADSGYSLLVSLTSETAQQDMTKCMCVLYFSFPYHQHYFAVHQLGPMTTQCAPPEMPFSINAATSVPVVPGRCIHSTWGLVAIPV